VIRKLGVLLTIAALPLGAQVRETIEVAVTSVEVVVTDAKGNRVKGLSKGDFEILVDGQPREITNFTEYTVAAPGMSNATTTVSAQAAPQPVAQNVPPRRVLLVFDSNTLTPTLRRSGAAAAADFIDTHVRPVDRVMIAVLTQGFTPRTDWTSDKAELRRVIEKIGGEVSALGADSELKRAEDEITYLIDIAASTVGTDPGQVVPPKFEEFLRIGRRYSEHALAETRSAARLLGTVVSQFATYPEKKAMIFVGEGVDTRPGWEIWEKIEAIRSGKMPGAGVQIMMTGSQGGTDQNTPVNPASTISPLLEAQRYNASDLLRTLADNAFRKGVPIYAINPGTNQDISSSIETNSLRDPGEQFARFASKLDGYKMVGEGSGGAAYVGMNAQLALNEVAADLGGYYSLGFRASGPPKRDSIRVRVRQPSHRVRTALAGAPPSPADAITDAVTAHHVLAPESNELEIALETGDSMAAGEKQKVTLKVIIPIRNLQLVKQGDEVTGAFDVYLSISDGKGYFSPVNKQTHQIRWPAATVPEDDERTMTYSIDVTMEPGASQISVGVVDQRSKKTGYEIIGVQG
jgi:VWFA-related protein